MQYKDNKLAFPKLTKERLQYLLVKMFMNMGKVNFKKGKKNIKTLGDIKTMEGQAQFVEDFVEKRMRYEQTITGAMKSKGQDRKNLIKAALQLNKECARYANVLKNSGMESQAILKSLNGN
jgi:superfamily II RNA helicase